jgi:glycosyltransferase involved in cell wall biosynthesis
MKICLVSQHYPPETAQGGVGTQTWNKARTLARLGHTVHVLSCAAKPGPELRSETDAGVVVHRLRPPGQDFPVYQTATYAMAYSWSVLGHLHGLMQRTAFDVIDFAEYGGEGFAYQLDRGPWNWVPVVVQLHAPLALLADHIGWPDKEGDFYRVGAFMEEMSIRGADRLMACSANIADFTAGFYRLPRESIDVVHCGVDAEAFRPGDDRERPEQRPTVLFVGNIAGNKGVETVFEAVLRLRPKYPSLRLQLLGSCGDSLASELCARAQRHGAAANIEMPGFIDRAGLPDFYRRADVFCSPAQYEGGVANVYLEAMACACPVVASTAGGAPEAVTDGVTGLLVPPGDVEAVARALDRLLSDAGLRRRLGREGRRRVESYFAMDKYIERVLAVYQKAIERAREHLDGILAPAAELAGV